MLYTQRQQEISNTALQLIANGGIQNLTIRNIAKAIGVTEPAIYRHFADKSEIIKSVIALFDTGIQDDIYKEKGFTAIKKFISARLQQASGNPSLAKVMFSEDFFINDSCFSSLILEMMHKHKALLAEKLQEAEKLHEIRSGFDPDTLFRLIMGPVRLLIKQWSISGNKFDLENSGKLLLETLEELLKYETENNRNPNK